MVPDLLINHAALKCHIQHATTARVLPELAYPEAWEELATASAVLFLLGLWHGTNGNRPEPCLILTKRSEKVPQPGDLCCPVGGIMPALDSLVAKTLTLPGFPMAGWPPWKRIMAEQPGQARIMRALFSTCLRESFEEMRLFPFDVSLLGPLPAQELVLFRRMIYPLAGWVGHQNRFFPNWEVAKVVFIPLRNLLDPKRYVRYRYSFKLPGTEERLEQTYGFPCFLHENAGEREILWGATCRITLNFLKIAFDFEPPAVETLPMVQAAMHADYGKGARP